MRTVYKYKLGAGQTVLNLPVESRVLDFNFQEQEAFLWAEVETEPEEYVKRRFEIYGTGHPIQQGFHYLKTCHVAGFVFHLYEETNR